MFISYKILLLFATFVAIVASNKRLQLASITQLDIHNHWKTIQENSYEAQQIIIHYSGLSENSLNQIFTLKMPKLKVLSFGNFNPDISEPTTLFSAYHHQYLTHKLLKTIVTSKYFQQLIELNLIGANLDDRFWSFMENIDWNRKSLKIEKLLLGNNYIGTKGFNFISKMPLYQLTQLDISNNLLADPQSVVSILKIICGNQTVGCSKKLKSLDVSSTCISSQGLKTILMSIDSSSLISLNISNLNFHQRNKYHQGYNLQVFQLLSNLSFPNLKILQMNDLALDQVILPIFKNWRFPNLQSLSLYFNFIDDASLKLWINKKNFPKLNRLILFGTDIKDQSLNFLSAQNFDLKQLNIGMTMISKKGLSYLNKMNISKLQKLFLKSLNIESWTLKEIFDRNEFHGLKELSLTNNKEISNLFQYFPWSKLHNLQTFILSNAQVENSLHFLLNSNKTLLPKLKYLMFNGTGINSKDIIKLVSSAKMIFPSLQYANLIPEYHQPINFTELIHIQTNQHTKFELGYVVFTNKDKIVLQQIKVLSWIILYSSKYNLFSYFDPTNQHYMNLSPTSFNKQLPPQLLQNITIQMSNLFYMQSVKVIIIGKKTQWQVFTSWIHHQNLTQFPKLTTLYILYPIEVRYLSQFLSTIKMPLLRNFRININVTHDTLNFQSLIKPMQKYVNLIGLKIKMTYNGSYSRIRNYNTFFNHFKYPFLIQLDLSQSFLQTEQIGGIVYNHSPTLRFINFKSNFIEYSFLSMIAQYQMTIKMVDISFLSISSYEFGKLGEANLGFITDFKADKCDLTNQHITALIQTNKKHRNWLFPKLGILSLNQNDIKQKGFRLLFQQSLYQLVSLRIKRNYNPHFLNMLLTYTTKIVQIVAVDVDIYALDKNIKPISTRRILTFAIQTFTFSEIDYQILGTLNFNRLKLSQIQTKNLHSCKALQHLLKVCSKARVVWFTFKSQSRKLNSTCLNLSSQKYREYQSQIEQLGLWDKSGTSFIPQFTSLLLTSKKNWRQILIESLHMPPQIFKKIAMDNMKQIQTLYLGENYLEDNQFSTFLQSPMPSLQFLRIRNTAITLKSLQLLSNTTLPSLQHLDLSGIPLGDKGINILMKLNAFKLKILFLQNCDIRSLQKFNQMYFPQVYYLYVSNNYLILKQVTNFLDNLNRTAWANLWRMDIRGIPLTVPQKQILQKLSKQKKVQLKYDGPQNIQIINSANY